MQPAQDVVWTLRIVITLWSSALQLRLDMLCASHRTSLMTQPSLIEDLIGFLLFLIASTKDIRVKLMLLF
jgi:hypothetical protein